MINRPKWFFEVCCTVLSNFQQAVGKCDSAFTTDAFQTLTNRFRDCYRHALSSKPGQLLREFVRFLVFDVEAHEGTILPLRSTILPPQGQAHAMANKSSELSLARVYVEILIAVKSCHERKVNFVLLTPDQSAALPAGR